MFHLLVLSWDTTLTRDLCDCVRTTGMVTERSARLKGTIEMEEPELVNKGGVTSEEIKQAKEDQELDRLKRVFM